MWVGLLWYLNFVQTPTVPKIEPAEHRAAISKFIAPNALFWFRYAALAAVVLGLILAWQKGHIVQALTFQKPVHTTGIGMWLALIRRSTSGSPSGRTSGRCSACRGLRRCESRGRTSCRHDLAHQHHALVLTRMGANRFPITTCANSRSRSGMRWRPAIPFDCAGVSRFSAPTGRRSAPIVNHERIWSQLCHISHCGQAGTGPKFFSNHSSGACRLSGSSGWGVGVCP
jgi:hypothetical protein